MDDSFPWEDLLDYIQDGKVVPILGHELLQAEYQGRRVTLQRLLAERLAEREKLEVQWNPHFELNDAVSAYLANPRAKLVGLYDRIAGFLRSLNPPFPVPDALLRLAEIQPFDLFMSVTFDSLMARALDQVRFGGNAITREIEFSINQSTAAQSDARKVRLGESPIVFNLFGRAVSKSDFALHDEDALEFIHRLVSGDVPPPDWLISELRNRHLLILGVHLPDWLGRFVLRVATRDRLRLAQRAYFIAGDDAPCGATLAQFLSRFGRETTIAVFEGTAEEFVGELHRRWKVREPEPIAARTGGPVFEGVRGSIFISYGRENLAAVERLHGAIESLGGDAWFDRDELSAGDHWEQKILPRIQRDVRLFVPVISDATAKRDEGYVFREWREALERSKKIAGRKFIVPVVVDADYQGNLERYQGLVDLFPAFQELHFGRAPGGEPDEALRQALQDEDPRHAPGAATMMEPSTRPGGGGQLDHDNPWPGLESYEEASAEFYIGRAAEAADLQRRIVDEPMTVLFGKSGLGKTSLLKAGVFPWLREKGFLPIFLRLQVRPGTEPLIEQVRLALFDALGAEEIEHPASADGETPWEYLHRTGQELWTRQNRLVQPVFVFDQFEELFTLGRMVPAEVAAFREDLADLVENRIPAGVADRLENRPASERSAWTCRPCPTR